jgi:ABC-type glycerol-3-phosphate transport system substrate-binding protein
MLDVGKWKNVRYGIPIEHGNFQQMYINVDMFKKAASIPDKPPMKFTGDWIADMKKLTIADPKGGDPTQVGFAIRSKGAPVGITDKFLPFAHAWGARMLSPTSAKATGYANSPEMIAALTFFGDLVNKDKVASLSFGNPEDAFGQKRAAVIFRESWFFGWLKKNAPTSTSRCTRCRARRRAPARARCSRGPISSTRTAPTRPCVGVHALHQQRQGRHGPPPDAGHPAGVDANSRRTT